MLQYTTLDACEARVLDAAKQVQFGELYEVDLAAPQTGTITVGLTEDQLRFIKLVRQYGLKRITKLVIHNGAPSILEVEGEWNGIKGRRKLKISA